MKILFVGMPDSIHVARLLNTIKDSPHRQIFFPVYNARPHPSMQHGLISLPLLWPKQGSVTVCSMGTTFTTKYSQALLRRMIPDESWRIKWLELMIRKLKPDLIHSIEFQKAGYLCLAVRQRMKAAFPPWLASNWGSDVYLFGGLKDHRDKVVAILEGVDFYAAECERDIALAVKMGLKGQFLKVVPNAGGFDLDAIKSLRSTGPTSARRVIAVKGYQHFSGRALSTLRAIEAASSHLQDYAVRIYSATPDVRIEAELVAQRKQLDIECLPHLLPHEDMLRLHGSARISMGIGISDGISTSFLEGIAMGSFPIQSCAACVDEWITHRKSGFIVQQPMDTQEIARWLTLALADDSLVDKASAINDEAVNSRLDMSFVKKQVLANYDLVESKIFRSKRD